MEKLVAVSTPLVPHQRMGLLPSCGPEPVKPVVVVYWGDPGCLKYHVVERAHSTVEPQKLCDAVIIGSCDT